MAYDYGHEMPYLARAPRKRRKEWLSDPPESGGRTSEATALSG